MQFYLSFVSILLHTQAPSPARKSPRPQTHFWAWKGPNNACGGINFVSLLHIVAFTTQVEGAGHLPPRGYAANGVDYRN